MLSSPSVGTSLLLNAWMRWPRMVPVGMVAFVALSPVLPTGYVDPAVAASESFSLALAQYGVDASEPLQPIAPASSGPDNDGTRAMGGPAAALLPAAGADFDDALSRRSASGIVPRPGYPAQQVASVTAARGGAAPARRIVPVPVSVSIATAAPAPRWTPPARRTEAADVVSTQSAGSVYAWEAPPVPNDPAPLSPRAAIASDPIADAE